MESDKIAGFVHDLNARLLAAEVTLDALVLAMAADPGIRERVLSYFDASAAGTQSALLGASQGVKDVLRNHLNRYRGPLLPRE